MTTFKPGEKVTWTDILGSRPQGTVERLEPDGAVLVRYGSRDKVTRHVFWPNELEHAVEKDGQGRPRGDETQKTRQVTRQAENRRRRIKS